MKLSRVGVDLAKNVYQLHGVDRSGKTILKRRLKRTLISAVFGVIERPLSGKADIRLILTKKAANDPFLPISNSKCEP